MQIKTLDLFAGCGGSSAGAQRAGARIIAAIDAWSLATASYKKNFPRAKVYTQRLEQIDPVALSRDIGPIDLLLASPECTNHTCARGSAKRSEVSRETAFQVVRFASVFLPRWVIVENVVQMKRWHRYRTFIRSLRGLGYNVVEQVLEANDFGVPQSRRRLFLMCDREQIPPSVKLGRARPKTAGDVIDINGKWKATPLFSETRAVNTVVRYLTGIEKVGEQKPFLLVYYGSDGGGGWQPLDRPLRTITTVDRFALIKQKRGDTSIRMLQVPELKRAMGFGIGYRLSGGTRREKVKLLGNAVCPPVMSAIVRTITASSRGRRASGK